MVGNFGNFFALAFLYLFALNLPLLPVQLLLTSLITDVPLITISSDTTNSEETVQPEKYDARALMFISLILGSFTAFFELLFFALVNSKSPQSIQTSMFLFLSFVQLIVIVSIRNHDYFWKGKSHLFSSERYDCGICGITGLTLYTHICAFVLFYPTAS